MKKRMCMTAILVGTFMFGGAVFATEDTSEEIREEIVTISAEDGEVELMQYTNPSMQDIDKLLTETALRWGVPPEVVKAVAYRESAWNQFENGQPKVSGDGGIGIMQVTDERFDANRLKTDIAYNIDAGVRILVEKFSWGGTLIPKIGDGSPDVIENWYFAVMAYNGLVHSNSPVIRETGARNHHAYQEQVFQIITNLNNGMPLARIAVSVADYRYLGQNQLGFTKLSHTISNPVQPTRYMVDANSLVVATSRINLRERATTDSTRLRTVEQGDVLTVLGSFAYDVSQVASSAKQYVWYHVQLPNGAKGYVASGTVKPVGERIAGANRYETSVMVSRKGWERASTVVLAKGTDFPDALAGAPLAYKYDAPILLTHENRLTGVTKQEIQRLQASTVIILGSEGAISREVAKELRDMGLTVDRIGGVNRYETAEKIADRVGNASKAIVAYGRNFPDALAIAPYAAKNGYPILLTNSTGLSNGTKQRLTSVSETIVVGGATIIPDALLRDMPNPRRLSGQNRYDTVVDIVTKLNMTSSQAFIATGANFPDALSGSVLAAKQGAPILLVQANTVPASIRTYVGNEQIWDYSYLGGPLVIGNHVITGLYR